MPPKLSFPAEHGNEEGFPECFVLFKHSPSVAKQGA